MSAQTGIRLKSMNRLAESLRETIEEEVAIGRMAPGTHLDEMELAKRFGVSRTPVREALSLLAGEGVVEIRARRGAVVAQLSPQRLVEMFEVMAELEAMCARLAARRIGSTELDALQQAHEGCRDAAKREDADAYFYANEHFHHAIYLASHNRFLSDQAHALQRRLRPYRRLQLRVRHRLAKSFDEHQSVLNALRDGDGDAAVDAIRRHVMVQGERFNDLLAGLSQLETQSKSVPMPMRTPMRSTADVAGG